MNVDPHFQQSLENQARDRWALRQLFNDDEIQRLEGSRCAVSATRRTIVYLVYENHFARGGGIFAVAKHLPPDLAKRNPCVVVLSPFHARLNQSPETPGDLVGTIHVPFGSSSVTTTVYRYRSDGIAWILFQAEGFFTSAGNSPYNQTNEELLRNGMFASAAIPYILGMSGIALTEDVVVHVQDWQLAATVLTVKQAVLDGRLRSAAVVLTSHNPYDCAVTREDLAAITSRTDDAQWARISTDTPGAASGRRATVYECMMPLMDAPVSTVSRQYARDLVANPLLAVYFADHLQEVFRRQGLVGIDNGLFMAPRRPFSDSSVAQAMQGEVEAVLSEKRSKRRKMLQALTSFRPPQRLGFLRYEDRWDLTRLPDDIPVFMMFGRMDPAQKGFDLMAQAIRRVPHGTAKFVICPIVPPDVRTFLDDWRDVACSRPGDVVVYTGRVDPYMQLMAGATYCVMPSLHEPFGAATEPYLSGTPVVAAATGGLVQQVIDHDRQPQRATGFLFGHAYPSSAVEQGEQWRQILDAPNPASRMHSGLYASLVNGLTSALREAIDVYRNRPSDYGRMLARLYDQAVQFTWEKAAAEYTALYDHASKP
ncbi:MAG: glycogen/starch synthase [Pirellulaceae bacterium]|nr:glycogen/starch synthase [Pirellulaceae bacterium]